MAHGKIIVDGFWVAEGLIARKECKYDSVFCDKYERLCILISSLSLTVINHHSVWADSKFFMIVDDSFLVWPRVWQFMIVFRSAVLVITGPLAVRKHAALFRREKFILLQVCLKGRHLVFAFLHWKSLELAALVTLLARLPVNYRQLSRTSLAVWPFER